MGGCRYDEWMDGWIDEMNNIPLEHLDLFTVMWCFLVLYVRSIGVDVGCVYDLYLWYQRCRDNW